MAKARKIGAKKSVFFRLALLAFSVYMIYSMILLQGQLAENRNVLAQKQQEIEARRISNEELKTLLESGSEQKLIEKAARDKLDYVYANEEVYVDISGN